MTVTRFSSAANHFGRLLLGHLPRWYRCRAGNRVSFGRVDYVIWGRRRQVQRRRGS